MRREYSMCGHRKGNNMSPTYYSWASMIQRCTNPRRDNYKYYGGRGIKVCEDWQYFKNFLKDMGERPEGLTLDRIDGEGNYNKDNCRWSSKKDQQFNRTWRRKYAN